MNADPFSLDKLHDLAEPARVGWWPPALGWWIVLALLAIWAVTMGVLAVMRWRRDAYRRAGLRLLEEIRSAAHSKEDRIGALADLSTLLKRVALTAFPRERVASLTGGDWLAFLDQTSSQVQFASEPVRRLAFATCEAKTGDIEGLEDSQFQAVCRAARIWIETHRAEDASC